MSLGKDFFDNFAWEITQFCKGCAQIDQDERYSPSVIQKWQSYINMRNLSNSTLNDFVWDRLESVLSIANR